MTDRKLGAAWADLVEAGEIAPQGEGATAAGRKPTNPGKITVTIDPDLAGRLREICDQAGYGPIIASPIVEDLLAAGVAAFDRGELTPKEEVIVIRRRLQRNGTE